MLKASSWMRNRSASSSASLASSQSLNALAECSTLSKSLDAMDYIMADDLKRATETLDELDEGETFPALGKGVMVFIEAALGFEADVIKDATAKLNAAEVQATRSRHRAQKAKHRTSMFPHGTEYYLAVAEAQLMGAVVLFLGESAISSVKSFYKLRRAYQILAEIYNSSVHDEKLKLQVPINSKDVGSGGVGKDKELSKMMEGLDLELSLEQGLEKESSTPPLPANVKFKPLRCVSKSANDNEALVDEYICSGVNLCFGILQLVISMIPPALSKILYVIGFQGDKESSIKMLWQATESENIHGSLALQTLLMYYSGPAQVCDIETKRSMHPRGGLKQGLARMRAKYPESALWILHEARMQSMEGDIMKSLEMLDTPLTIQMRQVEALILFEKAMCLLDLHRFEKAAHAFIRLTHLNTWSHALYRYVAGICYVELYRGAAPYDGEERTPEKIAHWKKRAEELITEAPSAVGRRKMTGRPMPLEVYLQRKIEKWQARATASAATGGSGSVVDGVGTSPANEIMYFWNGYKRMPPQALERSLKELAYEGAANRNAPDEAAVRGLLESVVMRNQGLVAEGRQRLEETVLPIDRVTMKKSEEWVVPCGLYERGVSAWACGYMEDGLSAEAKRKRETAAMAEASDWLGKAARYGHDYELSTRIGVRIQTGLEVLRAETGTV
ncbi:uncharacterized protein V1518DRAFT_438292 [Limtongia smithiae]|uniref:uncharacterized protein n=1 Tax=Limtongia smithiae TaxID=1125753 RepID=UPI0034CE341C